MSRTNNRNAEQGRLELQHQVIGCSSAIHAQFFQPYAGILLHCFHHFTCLECHGFQHCPRQVALVGIVRNHPGSVNPIIKSNNLLNNALAMQAANRRGGEEALMCNYRGELSECAQSNFFLVRDGVALTPKSQAGLLEGITRAFLFEVGRAAGIEVRDETFITSTTRELSPVVRIDDRVIGAGVPGPVTQQLLNGYRRKAQELTGAAVSSR